MLAKPDPATFQVLPWRGRSARHGADVLRHHAAGRHPQHRRPAQRPEARALAKCADMGYTFYTHPEIEFFLLKQGYAAGERPEPIDQAGYFDHVPKGMAHDFRRAAISMLESIGISVEFSHHEGAPGQNEIDLRYADALTTSDNIMTFRTVIKEVALERDIYATFMPKVFAGAPGLGHAYAHVVLRR
jgi:glutamine synthetase